MLVGRVVEVMAREQIRLFFFLFGSVNGFFVALVCGGIRLHGMGERTSKRFLVF